MYQFFERINQRDQQLEKQIKRAKMNKFDKQEVKKNKRSRVSGKRDWLNKKEEE